MSVRTNVADRIAEVLLDHPPVNAFDSAGWRKIAETITAVGNDPAVSVVLLAAEGRGFCAGVDIKELARDSRLITQVNKGCYDSFAAIHDCPVPVGAAAAPERRAAAARAAHGSAARGRIGRVSVRGRPWRARRARTSAPAA